MTILFQIKPTIELLSHVLSCDMMIALLDHQQLP
jgi:hypothetical protein